METAETETPDLLSLAKEGVTTTARSDAQAQAVSPSSVRAVHSPPPPFFPPTKKTWEERFSELKTWWYASDKGKNPKMPCDTRMARWVRKQRGFRDKGTLSADRLEQMNSLEDFYWTTITTRRRCVPARKWQDSYAALVEYYHTHNQDCTIPHYDFEHTRLYQWCNVQRQARNEGNLSENQVALLDRLQFQWTHSNQDRWDACFQQLAEYGMAKGHFRVPQKSTYASAATAQLGRWANKQRTEASKGRLQADRLQKLKDIGFFLDGEALLDHNPTDGNDMSDIVGTLTTGHSLTQQQVQTGQRLSPVMSSFVRPQDVNKYMAMKPANDLSTIRAHTKMDQNQARPSSREEDMRLLQMQQIERIQERRRRQRQQHLLILGLAKPNQLADQQNRSSVDHKVHVGEVLPQDHNNQANTTVSAAAQKEADWSLQDDDLLQELHQAQSRVNFLKAKLSKRMQNHQVRHASASATASPSPQQSQQPHSSLSRQEDLSGQIRQERQMEEHQKALLLLQQKQRERVRQNELLRRKTDIQQQLQRRQEHKRIMQKANATIMLAAVATAARACNMGSHRRSSM